MAIRRLGIYKGPEGADIIDAPKGSELLDNKQFLSWLYRIDAVVMKLDPAIGYGYVRSGVSSFSKDAREQYELRPPLSDEQFAELGALCAGGTIQGTICPGILRENRFDVVVADQREDNARSLIWGVQQSAA